SRSARFSAVACTRTSSSPGAGRGAGTSRSASTSGPPGRVITTARMSVEEQEREQCDRQNGEAHDRVEDRPAYGEAQQGPEAAGAVPGLLIVHFQRRVRCRAAGRVRVLRVAQTACRAMKW